MEDFVLNKQDIINKLHKNVCEVTFTKTNGEERVMLCTLNTSVIPIVESSDDTPKRTKKENLDVQAVYDVTANGWRSFRWDSVKGFSTQ